MSPSEIYCFILILFPSILYKNKCPLLSNSKLPFLHSLNNLLNKAAGDFVDAYVQKQGKRIAMKRQWLEMINDYGMEIVCYAYNSLSNETFLDQVEQTLSVVTTIKNNIENNLALYQKDLALWKINEESMINSIYSKFMDAVENRHALDERTEILPELSSFEQKYLDFVGGWKNIWSSFKAYYLLECTYEDFFKKIIAKAHENVYVDEDTIIGTFPGKKEGDIFDII